MRRLLRKDSVTLGGRRKKKIKKWGWKTAENDVAHPQHRDVKVASSR